ncbi:MAG: 3'-5' exonuclease [Candidatus Aminicenantes bacterium]|nr:3'-5' exonuclease [Candidatus Aminicenantes bacterium]
MSVKNMKLLFFDCETTGLPGVRWFSPEVVDEWPRLVQLAWARYDAAGNLEEARNFIVKPDGFKVPPDATRIHGISDAEARRVGRDLGQVLDEFLEAATAPGTTLVAHNFDYDRNVVAGELIRARKPLAFLELAGICTMRETTDLCQLSRPGGGSGYKWPTLEELHTWVFGFSYEGAHDAANDIGACARAFFKLRDAGHFRI